MIEHLPFTTDAGIGARARIGLVVLASDYTMEHEFRRVFGSPGLGSGVDYYEARIRNSPQITPETLAAMGPLITETVDLILPGAALDVVAFGCTSASMVLGEAAVAKNIHAARGQGHQPDLGGLRRLRRARRQADRGADPLPARRERDRAQLHHRQGLRGAGVRLVQRAG
jgi:hypothetical protein